MAPDRGSCYAGRMSLVATLAMLMLMLMPATAASIPAVKSNTHLPPQYDQLISERSVLCLKSALRLERRGE